MQLSHHYFVSVASPAIKEPLAISAFLSEGEHRRMRRTRDLLRGLDNLPPSVTVPHTRNLPHAILAVLLIDKVDPTVLQVPLSLASGGNAESEQARAELIALAQHVALAHIVPFRTSVEASRGMTSLHTIARSASASIAVYSLEGAPVLVIEAPGGVVAAGYRSVVEKLHPANDAHDTRPGGSMLQAAG
jgi:hypothetical protein